jgi:hypothetical protein
VDNVLLLLEALEQILTAQGVKVGTGARDAAEQVHSQEGA